MGTIGHIEYFKNIRQNIRLSISEDYLDLSLRTLADRAEIDFSNFLSFMNGDAKDLKLTTLIKIAAALGVPPQKLFDTPDKPSE